MIEQTEQPLVGIDLGTTNSLVAILQTGTPTVLRNNLGEDLTPSAVSTLEDEILVGAPARARATTHPALTALSFKRDMGTQRKIALGPRTFLPQELSALVLRHLKKEAEAALGTEIVEAVITVPAYFDELQRQATHEAARIAGLRVERLLNEPTAAAIAYGLHERHREVRAVVLDLGGGTFDITVLEIIEGIIEIQSSAGDTNLGGDDFTLALATHLRTRGQREEECEIPSEGVSWARMIDGCERAKQRLSRESEALVALPQLPVSGGRCIDLELSLTREEAEEIWQPLLARMRQPMMRALHDAKRRPEDFDEVILVGGATRMPCFVRFVAQFFGRMPLRTLPADQAVALGAAIQAGLKAQDEELDEIIVTDVASFSLGISTVSGLDRQAMSGLFSVILERGTVLPASRVFPYSTVTDGQTMIRIEVYQGEHSLVADNRKLGEFRVEAIPAAPAGYQSISVRFTYDLNGLLEVEATVESTGKSETLLIEGAPGRLSHEEIEQARQAMQRLKFHPREALPNTTALARAEALFVELRGVERQELGEAIATFQAALASQDEELIRSQREWLLARIAATT